MNTPETLLSVHIEKTAGTSVMRFFEDTVGREQIGFYDAGIDNVIPSSALAISPSNDTLRIKLAPIWGHLKRIYYKTKAYNTLYKKETPLSVPKEAKIIHGHFPANRFDDILPNAPLTIVFREPYERMVSHYQHWKRSKASHDWRIRIPFDKTISFEDFALHPNMQNYQAQALAGKELKDFATVGITDNLNLYFEDLFRLMVEIGVSNNKERLPHEYKLNQNPKPETVVYSRKTTFMEKFRTFHPEDYTLYEEACSRVNSKKSNSTTL